MKRFFSASPLLLTFMVMALVVLLSTVAGVDQLTSSSVGMAMAVLVRGPIDQLITIEYTHTAATTADTVYLLGGRVMLAVNSALANVENVFLLRGHIEYAKAAGEAWVGGQAVYWDASAGNFTTTSTDNTKAGFAMEAAASAATTGQINLEPACNL
jgi:predicted RecA/RadA family phage recombinase